MRIILLLLLSGFILSSSAQQNAQMEKRIAEILSKMSIEEKVGQMTQITIEVISKKQGTKSQMHELNDQALEEAITKYHVGSILNVYDAAHSVNYWHEILGKINDVTTKKTKLAIPVIYGIDAIHGATYTQGATLFPQAISMAATFNPDIAYKAGEITSKEVRASGIPWNFYPVLDVGRQVLWPRFWETFGEDPYLVSLMGAKYITGAQGNNVAEKNKLMTCLKHYLGYSSPNNGKDRSPAWISERMVREYFLPPFEAGIKAGAMTVMVNSGEIDGIPTHSDYHLLTEVLKQELNFKGFVVSDWEDIKRLYTRDRVASSPEEAVKMAVMAGVDMSMIPQDYSFYNILLDLVKKNQVPVSRIDDAVTRILRVKILLGLFENNSPDKNLASVIALPEHSSANLEAASQSVVMTKNDNILPLKPAKKILVTGPTANVLASLNSGWTITWQGNEETLYPKSALTVLKALQVKYGADKVVYSEGTTFNSDVNTSKTKELAKDADAVVICLGEPAYCETPGNINNIELDEAQLRLVEEVASVNKSVVLVMLQGRPRVINKIVDKAQAILVAMLPGMRGGEAIANIISGETVPSGKLPFSYPKYVNAFYHYDSKPLENTNDLKYDPQWPFGFGLSYTTFGYENLKLDKKTYTQNEQIKVSVNVTNKGNVAGMEAVQLYICDKYGSVSRPVRQLRGVQKIMLKPGETKAVEFTLSMNDLSFIGRDNKRIVEPGEFVVYVEKLEQGFLLQ